MGLVSCSLIANFNFTKLYFDTICHLEQENANILYKLLAVTNENEANIVLSVNKPYIKLESITLVE
jgi:hypothetical protein